jgi:hypothetical protein
MRPQRHARVLVLRSSRFVAAAIDAARRRWPDAEIRVAYQAGSGAEIEQGGLSPEPGLALAPGRRLGLWTVLTSRVGWRLLAWNPDEVVLQWWYEDGVGHRAVERAALLLQPRGFHAVLADGRWFTVAGAECISRFLRTGLGRILGAAIVLVVTLSSATLWPASAWFGYRERRRLEGGR